MRLDKLTDRQREVCDLLVKGHTRHEVAALLGINVKTVDVIRGNAWGRLGVTSAAQMLAVYVAEAIEVVRARLLVDGADDILAPLGFVEELLP
jgi:DNA-binding NarL/FixJ family response regulator